MYAAGESTRNKKVSPYTLFAFSSLHPLRFLLAQRFCFVRFFFAATFALSARTTLIFCSLYSSLQPLSFLLVQRLYFVRVFFAVTIELSARTNFDFHCGDHVVRRYHPLLNVFLKPHSCPLHACWRLVELAELCVAQIFGL